MWAAPMAAMTVGSLADCSVARTAVSWDVTMAVTTARRLADSSVEPRGATTADLRAVKKAPLLAGWTAS